jgi:hypothetical protein
MTNAGFRSTIDSCTQATVYLGELDPILWIPSELWFGFLRRRTVELSHTQKKLSMLAIRPKNYGLITSILSHMLQHVGISPIVKDQTLARALQDLQFHAISQRFGCFFLHNLDIETGHLPGIEKVDPTGLLWLLEGNQAGEDTTRAPAAMGSEAASALAVTWKKLCETINGDREQRRSIQEFAWEPSWLVFSEAEGVFCGFTWQFWGLLSNSAFEQLEKPPTTLKEAMELWTLDSVKARLKHDVNITLLPSGDELKGAVPEKFHQSRFEVLRGRFFPEPEVRVHEKSCWGPLFKQGYVRRYHEAIKESRDGGRTLKDALDGIMLNLQVLPYNPGDPWSAAPLWRCSNSIVTLLLNSSYIQLLGRTIKSAEGEMRGAGHRKLLSKNQLMKILSGEGMVTQKKRSRAHRLGRSKNWRQPPPPRGRRKRGEGGEGEIGVERDEGEG